MSENETYWDPQFESEFAEELKRAKKECHFDTKQNFELAIDYLEGRQIEDVRQQLRDRFPSSSMGDAGQEIYPQVIPITEKYVAEVATAYNRPVTRTLTWADGTTDETTQRATEAYKRALDECSYDEMMHANDRWTVLLGTSVTWHQFKRGKLRISTVYPHDITPVASDDWEFADESDPSDYEGFVVETFWQQEDIYKAQKRSFAYVKPEGVTFYRGGEPSKPSEVLEHYENPYLWPQVPEEQIFARKPSLSDLPILPLAFWSRIRQDKRLISNADPDIVFCNRELNVMWSTLFDTIRFQGFDTPVKKLANPQDPKAIQKHGARFPVVLQAGMEDFAYAASSAPYPQIVEALEKYLKLFVMAKRLSPNDFSVTGNAAISGFAKVIDSLAKLEARQEHITRLKAVEENYAFPINAAILRWAGLIENDVINMKCRTVFSDYQLPRTSDEKAKEIDFKVKYNLTTAAKELAKEYSMSEIEAQQIIDANAQANGQPQLQQATEPQGLFGGLIRNRKAI